MKKQGINGIVGHKSLVVKNLFIVATMLATVLLTARAQAFVEASSDHSRDRTVTAVLRAELYKLQGSAVNPKIPVDVIVSFAKPSTVDGEPVQEIFLDAMERTIFRVENPCSLKYLKIDSRSDDRREERHQRNQLRECEEASRRWTMQPVLQEPDVIVELPANSGRFSLRVYFPVKSDGAENGDAMIYRGKESRKDVEEFVIESVAYELYDALFNAGYALDPYGSYIDSKSWRKKFK